MGGPSPQTKWKSAEIRLSVWTFCSRSESPASKTSTLHRLLVARSGLSSSAGAAVLSGVRMKPAMDTLNGFLESSDHLAEKERLARAFSARAY